MTEKLLSMIAKRYTLTELNIGDMAKLKANGMTFTIKAYKAKGLGHVSVMRAKGFFGLMKMDTLIVNPTDVDCHSILMTAFMRWEMIRLSLSFMTRSSAKAISVV